MTSASAMARRACSWTRASIGSSGSSSRPPVSTTTKRRPFHSASPYSRSRVVRARSSTMAVRAADDPVEERALADVRAGRRWRRPGARRRGASSTRRRPGGPRVRPRRRRGAAVRFGQRGRAAGRGRPRARGRRRRGRRRRPGVVGRAGQLEDPLGRRRAGPRSASTCRRSRRRSRAPSKTAASSRSRDALDLDGRRAGDLAQPGQLLGVGARPAADDDHQVDLARPSPSCPPGGGS